MLNRVEKLKNKYKDMVEELKKCRIELERVNEWVEKVMVKVFVIFVGFGSMIIVFLKKFGVVKVNVKKKRMVDELMVDEKVLMMLGGMDDRLKCFFKKRGFDMLVLVEKLMFLIMLFLNKMVGLIGEVEGMFIVVMVGVKIVVVVVLVEMMEVDEEEE